MLTQSREDMQNYDVTNAGVPANLVSLPQILSQSPSFAFQVSGGLSPCFSFLFLCVSSSLNNVLFHFEEPSHCVCVRVESFCPFNLHSP